MPGGLVGTRQDVQACRLEHARLIVLDSLSNKSGCVWWGAAGGAGKGRSQRPRVSGSVQLDVGLKRAQARGSSGFRLEVNHVTACPQLHLQLMSTIFFLFTEENCTYFRHFTPGQDAEIFEYKTQKGA